MSLGERFESVLTAAQTGADWAVTRLYRDLHPAVLRYLRTQEAGEAEDLASETWLDVARSLVRFRGNEDDFRRWVFAIARRRLIDFRRRSRRRRTDPVPAEAFSDDATAGDAETAALEGMSTAAALARIAALPPDQAEVVLLRVVAGFSAKEVGRIMGKRPGTVRVLQHRALANLARDLAREPVTRWDSRAI
jgi:RNA polymerase sigma-70 factor, ECF subfamily